MILVSFALAIGVVFLSAWPPAERGVLASRTGRTAILVGATLVSLVVFFQGARPNLFPFDDSYISLSAARTFVNHYQIAVVHHRPLQGVTSPLHILMVGLLGSITGVEWAARLVSLAASIALVIGAGVLAGRAAGDRRAAWLASGLCLMGGPVLYDVGNGMETTLFSALLVWGLAIAETDPWDRRRVVIVGTLLGLGMLTRPEGVFAAGAVLGFALLRAMRRRDRVMAMAVIRAGVVTTLVYAPYLIANLIYTGSLLSPTVNAKAMFFRSGAWEWPSPSNLSVPFAFFFAGAEIVGLAGIAGLILGRRGAEGIYIGVFYLAYLVRFPDALKHYRARYQHPVWPLLAVGAAVLVVLIARRLKNRSAWLRALPIVVTVVVVGASMVSEVRYRAWFKQDLDSTAEFLLPTIRYVQRHTPKGMYVAAHDVGALDYFADRWVLDIVGLTDARVARELAKDHQGPAAIGPILVKKRPYLLVLLRRWEDEFLQLTRNAPPGMYTLLWSSPPNPTNGAVYDVYRCRFSVPPPGASAGAPENPSVPANPDPS